MRAAAWFLCIGMTAAELSAQTPDPPLAEERLSIHTLVREDIFAGWRADDMKRFERGEKNIEQLLEQRPAAKGDLLAWKAGAKMYRAVLAWEADRKDQFRKLYDESRQLFAEARRVAPDSVGVAAVTGGAHAMFTDRLPETVRAEAWQTCYDSYRQLWAKQAPAIDRMPQHISGELLAGLAQSSQRTGRTEELSEYLDTILKVLPDSPYARVARRWKENPQAAATGNISCKTCHPAGRLSAQLRKLEQR